METRSWKKIKSKYILSQIFDILMMSKTLNIIRYNKEIKNKLKRKLLDYKNEYEKIVIEIIPKDNEYGNFINFSLSTKSFYHIYFDGNNKMIDRNYIKKDEKVTKIKIFIDNKVKSLYKLFINCICIKSIDFIKFNRNDINNMREMFHGCSSLENINFTNFNTDNANRMNSMFDGCSSLKELNLSNFNTSNVISMNSMFYGCSSLEKLNLSNFNTSNVISMNSMFYGCSSLKELNVSNFNTNNVENMMKMFSNCSSLKELNLSNFNTDKVYNNNMWMMFSGCISLKILNISNFNIENKFFYNSMFENCNPEKIICSDEFKKKMKKRYPYLFISE